MPDPTRRTSWLARPGVPGRVAAGVLAAIVAFGCGGEGGDQVAAGGDAAATSGGPAKAPAPTAGFPAAPTGEVDQALAAQGAELFKSRGCVACHTFGGGRLVGPDLMGLTDRRTFEWTYAMITSPDSMLANDETARALLAEYYTPMPDQNVQPDEAMALYEHIRNKNEVGGAAVD